MSKITSWLMSGWPPRPNTCSVTAISVAKSRRRKEAQMSLRRLLVVRGLSSSSSFLTHFVNPLESRVTAAFGSGERIT